MRDPLLVPPFHRLDDYVGPWAFMPDRFAALWRQVLATDLRRHLAAGPPPKTGAPTTRTEMYPATNGNTVAVIPVAGTLMKAESSMGGTSTVQVRRDVRAAAADPNVSGILLRIDSPGGTVAGTADLAADVKAARRKKPVWSFVEDTAASAAYWVASQADQVFANSPTALVGSIGTVLVVYDESEAAAKDGVKTLVFSTGPLKGVGTPGAPVSPEAASYFQSIVNETQTHFDAAVQKGRGMNQSQMAAVRSGAVFPAVDAMDKRLIDGIRSLDSTLEALAAAK